MDGNTQLAVSDFLSQRELALVGISRGGKKFGNMILKELKAKGYQVYPVHPQAPEIGGQPCWPSVLELPVKVGGVVVVVPPSETEKVVCDIVKAGIPRVWMQQGSESAAAIRLCRENGISVVHGACILMFAEPTVFFHRVHRWIWRMLGKLPRQISPANRLHPPDGASKPTTKKPDVRLSQCRHSDCRKCRTIVTCHMLM